jgi:hypothetical protein
LVTNPAGVEEVHDRTGEMASSGDPPLYRLEASLPAAHLLIRRQPVLEEMQTAAGLEHPP